jgi:hypothetical protein
MAPDLASLPTVDEVEVKVIELEVLEGLLKGLGDLRGLVGL